jgi:hypothetical protein
VSPLRLHHHDGASSAFILCLQALHRYLSTPTHALRYNAALAAAVFCAPAAPFQQFKDVCPKNDAGFLPNIPPVRPVVQFDPSSSVFPESQFTAENLLYVEELTPKERDRTFTEAKDISGRTCAGCSQ